MSEVIYGALPAYAELQGASHAEEYVACAAQLGYSAIAITDECSLAGVLRAHVEAKAAGLPPIIGSHFRLTAADGSAALAFTALATNRNGYGNLCELVSLGRMRGKKDAYRLAPLDLEHPDPPYTHLRGLPDCLAILSPEFPANEQRLDAQVEWFARVFGDRVWVALTLHARAMDDIHRGIVERVAARHGVPVVATSWPPMHVRSRKPLQDALTAIRLGRPVSACGYELAPNAERHLRSRLRLANLYPAGALEETVRVARRCTFSPDDLKSEYPDEVVPAGYDPATYLRDQTYIGALRRFPAGIPVDVQAQIEHELQLIADLNYEAYFLTVYDIVRLRAGKASCAKAAVPLRTRRSATAWASPSRTIAAVDAIRAVHQQGTQRAAGYRRRFRASASRRSDAVHLSQVRPRSRGVDRRSHHLSAAQRPARSRQGAQRRPDDRRAGREKSSMVRLV